MRERHRWRSLLGLLLCIAGVAAAGMPAMAQNTGENRRVALVVGNFAYVHVPRLANSGNDATLVAKTLQQLGFTLIGGAAEDNLDKAHFDQAVQAFGHAIQGADVALFYYAGHGLQVDGKNWLVPTDANPTRPQDLDFQMVDADIVLKQMNGAGTRLNLVILDACRNNPFSMLGTRAVAGGLAQMTAPEGTMIAFATQPGNVAADGSGADGPYALALAASMHQPGLDIFQMFNHVGLAVQHGSKGVQVPWVSSSPIDGDFYFTPKETGPEEAAEVIADSAPALAPAATNPTPGNQTTIARGAAPALVAANAAPPTAPAAATAAPPPAPVAATAAPPPAPVAANAAPPRGAAQPPGASADRAGADRVAALQQAAAQGKADAQIDLGLAYAKGIGIARDDTLARQWFERAAQQGAAKAQYYLGAMVERGRGGPRSYAAAFQWYQRAADQGYPPAETALGRFYGRGLGVQRDVAQRTDWYRRAALHGSPFGQWALGNFYQFGNGVEKNMPQAVEWYQRSAKQGFVFAEVRLALLYEHGNGVARDYAQSLYWFRKAAQAGNAVALNSVGVFYRRGRTVPQDYSQAMHLFRAAADKGNAMAAYNIGLLYANGHGVPLDRHEARMWFEKAAAAGNQPAIDLLARQQSN